MILCQVKGHASNEGKYLCIYQACNHQRISCDTCFIEKIHDHNTETNKYLVSLTFFTDIISSYFIKTNVNVTDEILYNIVKNQLITIDEAIDNQFLQNKQTLYKRKCYFGLQINFSNQKKLMVTSARDQNLKLWYKYKLIKKKTNFILFNMVVFSEDDLYLYICQNNMIARLDVLQNFKYLDNIQLEKNVPKNIGQYIDLTNKLNFRKITPHISNIKLITNNTILVSIDVNIYIVDFNLKNTTLKIIFDDCVKSLDYQKKRSVILSYTNFISLWDQFGNMIIQNKGGIASKLNSSQFIPIIIKFIGQEDRMITVNHNGVIIWNIDYNQRILTLDKIIQSPSLIYVTQLNFQKNQIHLLRQQDLLTLSLTDYKYKVMKHKVKIQEQLTHVNYFNELVMKNYSNTLKFDQLVVIRSLFNQF